MELVTFIHCVSRHVTVGADGCLSITSLETGSNECLVILQ